MRMLANLVFEAIGDGLLNFFLPEFDEWLDRVETSGTERLLFRRKTHDVAKRSWHGLISRLRNKQLVVGILELPDGFGNLLPFLE